MGWKEGERIEKEKKHISWEPSMPQVLHQGIFTFTFHFLNNNLMSRYYFPAFSTDEKTEALNQLGQMVVKCKNLGWNTKLGTANDLVVSTPSHCPHQSLCGVINSASFSGGFPQDLDLLPWPHTLKFQIPHAWHSCTDTASSFLKSIPIVTKFQQFLLKR